MKNLIVVFLLALAGGVGEAQTDLGKSPSATWVAEMPSHTFAAVQLDDSFNLLTGTGTATPTALESRPPAATCVAQKPDGTFAYCQMNSSGQLLVSGGGGGAPTTCVNGNNYGCLNTTNTWTGVNNETCNVAGNCGTWENTNVAGNSGFAFANSSGTGEGNIGWSNASTGFFPNQMIWYSPNAKITLFGSGVGNFEVNSLGFGAPANGGLAPYLAIYNDTTATGQQGVFSGSGFALDLLTADQSAASVVLGKENGTGAPNTRTVTPWETITATGAIFTVPIDGTIATVATATTIAPVTAFVNLTGTTAIATITLPTGLSATVGSCINFIPASTVATTTAGNIEAVYSLVSGKAYQGCYNGTKWYFIGSGI